MADGNPKASDKGGWFSRQNADDPFLAGLQFWLFFLISFVLLGYTLPLAIIFGVMGGVAGGYIAQCWQAGPKPKEKVSDAEKASLADGGGGPGSLLEPRSTAGKVRSRQDRRQGSFGALGEGTDDRPGETP